MSAPASKSSVAKPASKEVRAKENISLEFMPMGMGYGSMQLKPCACGGGCPRCAANKNNNHQMLQAKLQVGAAHDSYEKEADRVADQVLATPPRNVIGNNISPRIQRLTSQTGTQMNVAPPSVDRALSQSGNSLEPVLQQDMEQRFGQDFSQVRVHTGTVAEQSAQDVSAHAYTVGNNIVFASGQFSPNSQEGKRLLAHELTHVVQQSGNNALSIQRYIDVDVLTAQVTAEQAQAMTDAELDREIDRLREYLSTLDTTSAHYRGASENLALLESTLLAHRPVPERRRSRSRERTDWVTSLSESEIAAAPLPARELEGRDAVMLGDADEIADAVRSQPEAWEEARRMTPDELVAEITRIREVMTADPAGSVTNEVNQERLNIFERELESRDALVLAHADVISDSRVRSRLGISGAFLTGFVSGALQQIPPGEVHDFFEHDLPDNIGAFVDGCDEGVPRGIIDGANNIVETVTSIGDVAMRAFIALMQHSDTISQLSGDAIQEFGYQVLGERLYTRVAADPAYLERRRDYERRAALIRTELQNFAQEFARDPSIVVQWSGELGLHLGQAFGRSVTEDFLRATPREQGVIVGRILGQIIFEIVLQLVLAAATEGAGNAARVTMGAVRGIEVSVELAAILENMARASAAVRRLMRIAETGEDVVETAVDVARAVETGGEILDTTADATRIVEGVPDLPSGTGALDNVVEETRVPSARPADPEVSTPREPSIDTETPHAEGARTAEPESETPAEVSGDTEAPSSDSAPPPEPETRPRTARERIEARRRAAADTRAEMEETLRLSRADSSVLTEQLEEIDRRLRIARRREASEVELLEEQREEIISQMQELIDERRLIGEDWLEASRAGAEASQEYFINITNRARRYYPDGLEAVFGSGTSVEHIVPRSRMFGMEGFERLTADQQVSLFAWEPNLRLVPAEFNSARGATPYARLSRDIWGRFTTDESIISRLAGAETTLEEQILNMIRNPSTIPPLPR